MSNSSELEALAKAKYPDPINGHWWDPEDFNFRRKKMRQLRKDFLRIHKTNPKQISK